MFRQKLVDRSDLKNNPYLLYVFGDNVARTGLAGQAASMRGEKNAFGVATLMAPGVPFKWDVAARQYILLDLSQLLSRFAKFKYDGIVWPTDGIGTGLANMPPELRTWMDAQILDLFGIVNELK